jgi:hypothetical protein
MAGVAPRERQLRLYGAPSEQGPLDWSWVDEQLATVGTYWVVVRTSGHPHPRPVWGIWHEQQLHLSVGSPTLSRAVRREQAITVHSGSGTDVVIVEGIADPAIQTSTPPEAIAVYNRKYDWDYDVGQYGDLTVVEPTKVMAWRSAGWAGRDGFQSTGCWVFDDPG